MSSLFNDIRSAFLLNKASIVKKLLIEALKYQQAPLSELLDSIVELLRLDNFFFMDKIYKTLILKLENYKHLDVVEIDKYILQNYCFIIGEKFLATTYGIIEDSYSRFIGRIYITNYRIIASGQQIPLKPDMGPGSPGIGVAIASAAISHRNKFRRDAILRALRKGLSDENLLEWGYYYPINETFNSKKTDAYFLYFVNIPTEKAVRKFKIKIIPKKSKFQTSYEFQIQRKNILYLLQDLIVYQSYANVQPQGIQEVQPISESPTMKISSEIINTSETAILIQFQDKEIWIPRSVIHSSFEEVLNMKQEFELPVWLLRRHHLI